jgi:hypothetical protein
MSLLGSSWKTVRWREGTRRRRPLHSRFAALRVQLITMTGAVNLLPRNGS